MKKIIVLKEYTDNNDNSYIFVDIEKIEKYIEYSDIKYNIIYYYDSYNNFKFTEIVESFEELSGIINRSQQ